jgi:hypothetical protein
MISADGVSVTPAGASTSCHQKRVPSASIASSVALHSSPTLAGGSCSLSSQSATARRRRQIVLRESVDAVPEVGLEQLDQARRAAQVRCRRDADGLAGDRRADGEPAAKRLQRGAEVDGPQLGALEACRTRQRLEHRSSAPAMASAK